MKKAIILNFILVVFVLLQFGGCLRHYVQIKEAEVKQKKEKLHLHVRADRNLFKLDVGNPLKLLYLIKEKESESNYVDDDVAMAHFFDRALGAELVKSKNNNFVYLFKLPTSTKQYKKNQNSFPGIWIFGLPPEKEKNLEKYIGYDVKKGKRYRIIFWIAAHSKLGQTVGSNRFEKKFTIPEENTEKEN